MYRVDHDLGEQGVLVLTLLRGRGLEQLAEVLALLLVKHDPNSIQLLLLLLGSV